MKTNPNPKPLVNPTGRLTERESLRRRTTALFGVLGGLYGSEKLTRRAEKLGASKLMRSRQLSRRVLALQRLIYDDAALQTVPKDAEISAILEDAQERIADLMAQQTVSNELQRRVADRMRERQEEYLRELRLQLLQELGTAETPATQRKLEELDRLDRVRLAKTALEAFRQAKLLKVLEDKRVFFESSYYDPDHPHLPAYVRRLFDRGAPADFVLIGATTKEPDEISPTLRSRCAEVFFEALSQEDVQKIVRQAARRVPIELGTDVPRLVSDYTIEGRKSVSLLSDAFGVALYRKRPALRRGDRRPRSRPRITAKDLLEVVRTGRMSASASVKASEVPQVGRIFALGVTQYVGSVIEIEATAFPAGQKRRGTIRFNETAGTMAKDSVFNAASVIRKIAGIDVANHDVHVNVIGGGQIDGPSAGLAVVLAMLSAIQRRPLRQDVAVTGEVSIQGKIKQVGGIAEKIYGARQAGMRKIVVPEENRADVPADVKGIDVSFASVIEDVLAQAMVSRRARTSPH